MYNYLNLDSEYYQGLIESIGKEMILDIIIKEIPENFSKYTQEIEQGIKDKNYNAIKLAVHTIKSDLRHFINKDHTIIEFVQDFENRAYALAKEKKTNGYVNHEIDFTPDLEKLKEITSEPHKEIVRLGEEYKNE